MGRQRQRPQDIPVRATMCATCPFRDGSPMEYLRTDLALSALRESNRICHSTGGNTVVHSRKVTKGPSLICRGARDLQLRYFTAIGFLPAATDEEWQKKVDELLNKNPCTSHPKATKSSPSKERKTKSKT